MGDKAKNPCVSICKVKDDICIGCGRSRDEMKAWKSMKNKERRAVNEMAAARLKALGKKRKKK
ncbi:MULTISPECIES: DUF1289 domain-containing protein [Pseudomonadaceae]|uniref:DUF1289 domain-containing protein n=1 Tax=Pseudomonadaceae TaxID=135621 RepID=UPI000F7A1BAD|nr:MULTISPECIES: DUF1289 domain-containing protein [Pseudomonadaceae]MCF6783335.1 DUF1289 domain-containing protein [Stutzerimonas stutzeri]MCF6806283.1 DUF1289 domain-containing protein [Stutzerimonas stutzeri]RRV18201.1 DUF1289 domain-containing protein [Pseudomonas saudiphocaensis]